MRGYIEFGEGLDFTLEAFLGLQMEFDLELSIDNTSPGDFSATVDSGDLRIESDPVDEEHFKWHLYVTRRRIQKYRAAAYEYLVDQNRSLKYVAPDVDNRGLT